MGHRKWDEYIWVTTGNLREEHNDTVDAWQAAVAEAERLGRANSDLCDQIAAIRVPFTDAQIGRVARSLWGNTCGDWSHTAIRAALAAEVDELRDQLSDENTNAASVNDLLVRVQNLTADRDELQRRLNAVVAMLEPGDKPEFPGARTAVWKSLRFLHARACEIAGRTE